MLADANLDAVKTNMSTAQAKIFNREEQSRPRRKLGQSVNCLYSIASQLDPRKLSKQSSIPLSRSTQILKKAQRAQKEGMGGSG